uniref:hypothetical protein n=1 Tax=Caballeronia glathei TaxID=60547 RepID=UPI001F4772CE|nr:hypothetical protein [Caballeronia glathei]
MSGARIRHQKLLREWLDIRAFDAGEAASLAELASAEARTKIELPGLINAACRRAGPAPVRTVAVGDAAVHRKAGSQRSQRNNLWAITGALRAAVIERIDALLVANAGRSGWDDLKQEPKRPAAPQRTVIS